MLVDLGGQRLPQGHRVIGGPLGHKQPGMVAGHGVAVVDAVGQELGEEVGQGQRLLGRTGRRIAPSPFRPAGPQHRSPSPPHCTPQSTAATDQRSVSHNQPPPVCRCLSVSRRSRSLLPAACATASAIARNQPALLSAARATASTSSRPTACAARPLYDQLHRASCCCDSCQSARAVTSHKPAMSSSACCLPAAGLPATAWLRGGCLPGTARVDACCLPPAQLVQQRLAYVPFVLAQQRILPALRPSALSDYGSWRLYCVYLV